eukprot:1155635-Pelagomonas_calceolata.AAC.14
MGDSKHTTSAPAQDECFTSNRQHVKGIAANYHHDLGLPTPKRRRAFNSMCTNQAVEAHVTTYNTSHDITAPQPFPHSCTHCSVHNLYHGA